MKMFGWEDARAVLAQVAPDSEPVIASIDFHYEEVNIRDGSGVVQTTRLQPTGATIKVRI